MSKLIDTKTGYKPQISINATEVVRVSAPDFALILDLLEHPPKPNAKLLRVIEALPNTL
ncbi:MULTISPECIES: DUF1778 domain-containing protein [Mesorhizobium]|uniref:type II toxin -antitoxin system TacA 1-like antitoxin n=1 Tax=Mesorhizobium TaxID=68287 RepID=UPI001459FBCC|nr:MULTISPECIES: DUF1778 domain-containing protein [Mesorhizobium]